MPSQISGQASRPSKLQRRPAPKRPTRRLEDAADAVGDFFGGLFGDASRAARAIPVRPAARAAAHVATLPYRNARDSWRAGHGGRQSMAHAPRSTGIVMPVGVLGPSIGGRAGGIAFGDLPPVIQQALRVLAMQRNPAVQGSLGLFPMDEYRVRQERRRRPRR